MAGAFAKLEWAQKHLTCLQRELLAFEERNDYVTQAETDPKTGREVLRALYIPPPPSDLALIFSDVVHNLEAALDYAVYRRPRRASKGRRKDPKTFFPIFPVRNTKVRGKPSYAKDGIKAIKHLSAPAQEFIEAIQPYHRYRGRRRHPILWELHQFARAEKHHGIPLVGRLGERRYSEIHTSRGEQIPERVDSGPVHFDQGDIAAVLWSPLHPEIRFKPHLILQVFLSVEWSRYRFELGSQTKAMHDHVAWVLGSLQRLL